MHTDHSEINNFNTHPIKQLASGLAIPFGLRSECTTLKWNKLKYIHVV